MNIRLADGTEITADEAEDRRHRSEARYILNLPTLEERRDWLQDLEKRRGIEAVDRLRKTMTEMHEARNA